MWSREMQCAPGLDRAAVTLLELAYRVRADGCRTLRASSQRRTDARITTTAAAMSTAVRIVSTQPCVARAGSFVIGRKLPAIDIQPAVNVVTQMNESGRIVVHPKIERVPCYWYRTICASGLALPNVSGESQDLFPGCAGVIEIRPRKDPGEHRRQGCVRRPTPSHDR